MIKKAAVLTSSSPVWWFYSAAATGLTRQYLTETFQKLGILTVFTLTHKQGFGGLRSFFRST